MRLNTDQVRSIRLAATEAAIDSRNKFRDGTTVAFIDSAS